MKNLQSNREKAHVLTKVCMVAFFLSNISYLPVFADSGLTQWLSLPAWGLLGVTLVIWGSLYISSRDIPMLCFLAAAAVLMAVFQAFSGKDYFSSLLTKCVIIAVIVSFIGEMVASSGKVRGQEKKLFTAYIAGALILCTVVYFTSLRGQDLTSRIYSYTTKNETAFLAISAIVLLLFEDYDNSRMVWRILRTVLVILLVVVVALMRCRSMLLCVPVILAVYLFRRSSSKQIKVMIVLIAAAMLIALQNDRVYDVVVNQIILGSRETNDVNDISSGRIDQIRQAFEKLDANFWTGTGDTNTVDCFYISVLMQYGILIGPCLAILSICPAVWGFMYYQRTKDHLGLILTVCSVCYIIGGFFEENAPFGPGTRCYLMWFLWGYLKMSKLNNGDKDVPESAVTRGAKTTIM